MEDLNVQKQNIVLCSDEPASAIEQAVDCDITLPDYLRDIQKILKCVAVPGIASVAVSGNRITAEGSVVVRIIYLDEANGISTYEQSIPFAKYVEMSDLSNVTFVDCVAKTGYMNSRAVSQRRIDIHGAVSLKFTAKIKREVSVVTDNVSACIEKRANKICIANLAADAGRYFSISEVETLKERPAIASIIKTNAYALVNEVKVIKDKALVKGDLLVSVSYTTNMSSGIECYDTRMPISQIVDAAGLDENEIIDTFLRVTQISVVPKPDSSGENKLLDISAKLLAEMHAYKECEFSAISDAYCIGRELCLETCEIPVLRYIDKINDTIVVSNNLNLPETECSEVLDVWFGDITSNYIFKNGTLEICGSVLIGLIGGSSEDALAYYERTVDFTYTRQITDISDVYLNPCVIVTGQNIMRNPDGGMDVKVEISICANIFEREKICVVSDITLSENGKQIADDGAALIIYFAGPGESVWDIARQYNTTVGAILAENEICDDVLQSDVMLLIPR